MVTINLDDATANALRTSAAARGCSLEDFLRLIAKLPPESAPLSFDDLVHQLNLLSSAEVVDSNYSRAEIYQDHD
ncbi:hypothetical protein ETAA8_29210 [Anatilimnocola aggregata]|uniref:Antitoxin FitA-like ribbon-helix-helix domain-containing protein n=1 Tax=Anatilimnocola aggregata TaxID=2528021 RepID=A0A517YC56_9BACT|nr:hypothetical protein [Anatilimnocola aggregata]QDU27830.1 hypothetical protein ETAA8_29210 [Anatilimnocola aggregata]